MAKKYKTVVIGNCRQCPYLDSPDAPYFHDSSCIHPATKIYTQNYEPPDVSPDNIPKGCPLQNAVAPDKFACPHCHQLVNGLEYKRHYYEKHRQPA